MKYLRSYLLVPGAGGQILGSRSSGHRSLRRLTTTHRHSKVTCSSYKYRCLPERRQVSTDGAKKSQLAVVGQVAPPLPTPSGAKIKTYVSVQRHRGAKTYPRHDAESYPLNQTCPPRHCNPYFSVSPKKPPEPLSYGQFLSEANSLKPSLDPLSLEMAFLPTFQSFRNDIEGLFFANRPKSAGIPYSSTLDATPLSREMTVTADSEFVGVERSKSIEALLPTTESVASANGVISEVPIRHVKREIVLPRTVEPASQTLNQSGFENFLEVHNFQKKGSEGEGGEKSEDISPFPKCEESPSAPYGSFIIENDRSSIIIHRDLYITNRILEKLKKIEEKPEITPEQTVKTSAPEPVTCSYQGLTDVGSEELTLSDSGGLADIAESAIAAKQSSTFRDSFAPGNHSHEADSETCLEAIRSLKPCLLSSIAAGTSSSKLPMQSSVLLQNVCNEKSEGPTNIEFGMPSGQISAFESMALQARKNLYARMKNASSPCVLVDGVHVKYSKLEDFVPKLEKGNSVPAVGDPEKSESEFAPNCCRLFSSENDTMPEGVGDRAASLETNTNLESNSSPSETVPPVSTQLENSLSELCFVCPESNNSTLTIQQHADIDSQFQGVLDLPQLQTPLHDFDQHTSLGGHESDKLQSDLEDWFIPLGKEIESMLLTLEASKNRYEYPERIPHDLEENSLIFEEDICNVRKHETIIQNEPNDSHPFEGIEIIENALLSPRGHQPFAPGRSRDKNTISGSLPPKSKNPNIDIKTETTIKCSRSSDNTDISVIETQRYLDKRLPYPFCTETVLQVYGTSDSLSKATQAVENSKAQLVHLNNANSPNPGMLTPKLQFNHMLSKSHDNFKPNSKKTVLKIKVVPNTETSSPNIQTSEPKPQPSHVLQLIEQPSKVSTDVSKLIRKSKFNHKTGPKNLRRGDSVMKLRPKKKFNKDSSENIKILSPKDLEKMFPSPPKLKPVEKPRKVTIETKMGKESPDVVDSVKQHSTQVGIVAAQFKGRKVQDDILKKPGAPTSKNDMKVVGQSENGLQVAKNMNSTQVSKVESDAALSARDQRILQSLISHKVKDSFMAVTKKAVLKPEVASANLGSNASPEPKAPRTSEPKTVADQESSVATKPLGSTARPKSPISQTVDSFSSAEIKYDVNKTNQVYQNDPKTVYATILETAKEKPKEKVPPKVPRPKNPRPESPTPKPNRQYINIKTEPTPKTTAGKATPEKAPTTVEKKVEKKLDESTLPISASTVIANVMKSSSDSTQSESRWRQLDQKTALSHTANEHFPREKTPVKSASDVQRRSMSANSNIQQKSQNEVKPEVRSDVRKASPIRKNAEGKEIGISKMDDKFMETFKDKKVWNLPTEPLFFPFETPNFKEMLEKPSKSRSVEPIPNETSVPKASAGSVIYEADFCKLCTENIPGLVASAPAKYRVPLDRMKDFPLVNPGKAKTYSVPSAGAVSINPMHDLMLMRNLTQVPAVTKVLSATLSAKSQQALDRWKQGLISTLGEQGFLEFYQNQLKRGTDFHSAVKKFLVDRFDCRDDLCMRSLSGVLGSVSDVSVVESQVVHPLLGYRGVIDCVAKFKGKPVVIEWKRSDKAKPSLKHTYDAPLQLSAYFGAMNFDSNYKAQQVEGGVVVVAYSDGSPADLFELSVEECERYWAKWLKRLHQYYTKTAPAIA